MISVSDIMERLSARQLLFFGIAGVVGYGIDASITTLLHPYLGVYAARIPAFIAAATATWFINRSLTFGKHTSRHTSLFREYTHYLLLMVAGLVVNYGAYVVSIMLVGNIPHAVLICVAIGSLAGMLVNFVVSKKFIFTNSSE